VQHNFCPRGDVDLSYFQVKQGRFYKVETKALAYGVDTVMAVGDLSNSTPCMPAGCWNDDAAALTFASKIEFQAIEDDVALITVSNRGGNNGTEATYELVVIEYQPTPTPSPSALPSGTWTATPTATATPRHFADVCEVLGGVANGNYDCARACAGFPRLGVPYLGALSRPDDKDWFLPASLPPGRYRLTLQPPPDQDYDMSVRLATDPRNNNCPIADGESGPLLAQGAGEGQMEMLEWTVVNETRFAIEVLSYYGYYDPYNPYVLLLQVVGPAPTATSGSSPTPTDTATPTLTPSLTPVPFEPPIVTDTPTPTPPVVAARTPEAP
jgi:hypothetical protein